jgi:hypothetical protein
MTTATVKYITNGYTVQSFGSPAVPDSLYAATIPEVVYWLGRLFDPLAPARLEAAGSVAPRIINNNDPLLGQQAQVETIASGGFLVRQFPNPPIGGQLVETYAVDLDAVSALLTQIFTPPQVE